MGTLEKTLTKALPGIAPAVAASSVVGKEAKKLLSPELEMQMQAAEKPEKPMPLPEDEQARLAKRRAAADLAKRRGRSSTIKTAFTERLGASGRGLG